MERVDASVELVARKYIYALFPYSCVAFHAFFFPRGMLYTRHRYAEDGGLRVMQDTSKLLLN